MRPCSRDNILTNPGWYQGKDRLLLPCSAVGTHPGSLWAHIINLVLRYWKETPEWLGQGRCSLGLGSSALQP